MGGAQFLVNIWQQSSWFTILVSSVLTYIALLANYRLFFHPLARIPGPKIAALTTWWEVYENVWRQGHLPLELKKLHKTYGSSIVFVKIRFL